MNSNEKKSNFKNTVNIGLIDFLNCMPINYSLDKKNPANVNFTRNYPAEINRLLKENKIHLAPISSIEYLINENSYILIKEACITSEAECGSVILFSEKNPKDLKGKTVALPHDSATSIAMLKVLLKSLGVLPEEINFIKHQYKNPIGESLGKDYDAVLYIGDNALKSAEKYKNILPQYDLGRMWKDTTGLPPVFGVWAANAEWAINQQDDFKQVKLLISQAVEAGLGIYFNEVVKTAVLDLNLSEDLIKDYLTAKIKYKFTSEHEKSLRMFKELYL